MPDISLASSGAFAIIAVAASRRSFIQDSGMQSVNLPMTRKKLTEIGSPYAGVRPGAKGVYPVKTNRTDPRRNQQAEYRKRRTELNARDAAFSKGDPRTPGGPGTNRSVKRTARNRQVTPTKSNAES